MESDEEEIGMPERPEAGPPGAQSSAPTVDPVSPQIPENFATDLLLPQIPDPGAIDSYLAEWMAYEENPYFRRPPSQNPPFPEGIAASQTFPQRTIEDATRGLSLGQEGIGSNQGQFSLERAQYETGPVNIGVDQPSMPETLFSFPIEDISDDTPRPGQESGMPLASTSQGPSPGYLEPMSFEEERPGLQRYGLRSRGRSQALSLSLEESGSESPSPSPSVTSSQEARPKRPRSGVFGRTVSTVGQVVKGGVAAVSQVIPTKRSRDPDIIKEKEKARNRRAQRAFRERQKALQEERAVSMKTLQTNLQDLGAENESLKAQLAALQESHEEFIEQDLKTAVTVANVPVDFGTEPVIISSDPNNIRQIPLQDLKTITFEELVEIWKGYIATLGPLVGVDSLGMQSVEGTTSQVQVEGLVKEIARLTQAIALFQPLLFLRFQNTNYETLSEEKAPRSHWRSLIATLPLSKTQTAAILEMRRTAISKLAKLLDHRNRLLAIQVQMLEAIHKNREVHTKDITLAHQSASAAVEELSENLKTEQALIVRDMCTLQQSILTGAQLARFITLAWPYYPGKMESASVLAQLNNEPSTFHIIESARQESSQTAGPSTL